MKLKTDVALQSICQILNLYYNLFMNVKELQSQVNNFLEEMQSQTDGIDFIPLNKSKNWERNIVPQLSRFVAMKYNGRQIINVLQMFRHQFGWQREEEYQKGQKWNFRALYSQYSQILPALCKQLAQFLLTYKPAPIPILISQIQRKVQYSKKQIYYILVLMFFCLTPKQVSDCESRLELEFSHINNFAHIFTFSVFKTKCIVEYFKKQSKTILTDNSVFTIIRNVAHSSVQKMINFHKQRPMTKIKIEQNDADIESFVGDIKIDFANRYIGGGCLTYGCVQEEIMFAVRPELLAVTQLCQKMKNYEALAFIGFQKHFKSKGYGTNDTYYNGPQNLKYQYIKDNKDQKIIQEYIVGIDAIKFRKNDFQQFQMQSLNRQILKAYVGFTALPIKANIVTGNWGCGVYNGDHFTKLMIQWIAATLAQKQLIFCPFGKKKVIEQGGLLHKLKGGKVGQIYQLLIKAGKQKRYNPEFSRRSILQIMTWLIK